ncbi:MAG TPA: hypothetical protein VLC92_05790 [Rhodocyclaceae bacterium]|nr:hypothetical protein [Rhodocyclaceae bacterium]
MNFQSLGSTGLTENTDATLPAPVDAPTVTNTKSYSVKLEGKLRINTTQAAAAGTDATWSVGVVQFANATSSVGKVTIASVQCPFKLTINHAPSSSGDAARKLRVTFGGNEVYLDGNGNPQTATLDSKTTSTACATGSTNVEAYGWNGTQGAGVRIFDLKIEQ